MSAATREPLRLLALLALAVLAAGLIAACGSDDGDDAGRGGSADSGSSASEATADDAVVESSGGRFDAQRVYRQAASGVVTVISVFGQGQQPEGPLGEGRAQGQGSGFVISDDGEIVTNAHVVTTGEAGGEGELRRAREVYVEFPDRNRVEAEIVGFDPYADIALLDIDPGDIEMSALELGHADSVRVGEPVAAIGSPFGEEQSLSVGVVSATDRTVPSLTRFAIDGVIQTDASINPGNSGGPLLNSDAEVIGVNQQIATRSGANDGVGFAVPVDLTRRSIQQLRDEGEVTYAFIGVTTQPIYPQLAERLDIDASRGALVVEISDGSPAQEAGLRGGDTSITFQGSEVESGGDVIVAVDGEEIDGESDLPRIISRKDPGETVELEIIRDGDNETIEVTLAARSES